MLFFTIFGAIILAIMFAKDPGGTIISALVILGVLGLGYLLLLGLGYLFVVVF